MKRVEVRWLDSMLAPVGWHRGGIPATDSQLEHVTVGLLAETHRRYIVVCAASARHGNSVAACIAIPKVAITRMRRLK